MSKIKTTAERGKYKELIHSMLYKSSDIKMMLLGDTTGMSSFEIQTKFKDHVKSHLFIDDTIQETDTYIFYDIIYPSLKPNIKNCKIIMYIICHRDILEDNPSEDYFGNRTDALSQMVENILLNSEVSNEFGIGELSLDSVDIYNSNRFYGCILTMSVPNFR